MNRRKNFRAAVHQFREGRLCVGREEYHVHLHDESAGGLCVVLFSDHPPETTSVGQLKMDDGDVINVKVTYRVAVGESFRIGLQRIESAASAHARSLRPAIPLTGLLAGLGLGLIVASIRG